MTTTTLTTSEAPATQRRRPLTGALIAAALLAAPLHAGWRPVGPYGGTVTLVAVDPARPSTVLACTATQGLFRSDDGGTSWEPVVGGFYLPVSKVVFDPVHSGRVYAVIGGDSVIRSSDDGRTWSSTGRIGHRFPIAALAVDPHGGSAVYASSGMLFRSTDRGGHWVALGATSLASGAAASLAVGAVSSVLYSVTDDGVYRSRDGGATFKRLGLAGMQLGVLALAPSDAAVLYTAGKHGLFRSGDGGAHWQEIDAGLPGRNVTAVAVHPRHPGTLDVALQADRFAGIAGTPGGLFESTDGGAHGAALGSGLPGGDVLSVAVDPTAPSRVYTGLTKDGVFRSADAGSHWSWANTGLRTFSVRTVAVDPERPSTVYAGPAEHGLYKSADAGQSWQLVNDRVDGGFSTATVVVDPHHTATVYTSNPGRIERSDDGGQSWKRIDTGAFPAFEMGTFALDPHDPSTLYAGGDLTVSKSTDRGDTWSDPAPLFPPCPVGPLVLVVSPAAPYEVYASGLIGNPLTCTDGDNVELLRSSDGGASWVPIGPFMRQVIPDPTSSAVVYALDYFFHFLKSTDGGLHFAPPSAAAGSLGFSTVAIDPAAPSRLYAGFSTGYQNGGRVFASDDGFVTWQQVGGDLDGNPIALAFDPSVPGRIWASTDRSVFVFDP
jgi:photosystem II stability/assembly factor-like uncharacterized protein